MSLELNPENGIGLGGAALDGRGVGERKKKSLPQSDSSGESSNYDTLETALSLDVSAYAPFYCKS